MALPGNQGMLAALRRLTPYNDLVIASLVLAVVLLIVVPISPLLLDFLLIVNLTISMTILLTTMFTAEPLDFSVYPTLLLVVTLFRLALNISSTRLVLSQAFAGHVIQAFGSFVVRGNYIVGFIIFLIITVIQFVVITHGAQRVAEVAARFTLDALPGKQMSIDADLNAGLITEEEAKRLRRRLQREADFYGAMDGASKFVRGDAIAGLIIIVINILGGLAIGTWQFKMSLEQALETYTRLTIGDGLVTQIPALLVSTATGILVTRSGATAGFTSEVVRQLTAFPRGIGLVAGILFFLGLVPGLPSLPFFILALGVGYAAYILAQEERRREGERKEATARVKPERRQPENVLALFEIDPLEIEIGYGLIPLADESEGGDLLDRLAAVRRQCALELGIYVKPIRIRDNLQLPPNAYVFKIRGVEAARGELMPGYFLAMNPAGEGEVPGLPTREPVFGLPAWWVTPAERQEAEVRGFTVVDCTTVLVTHLIEFIKAHAHELLGRQETRELLDKIKETSPAVVEELVPNLLSLGEVQKVLQSLLKERVPIRDLTTILEALADAARVNRDLDFLIEAARRSLYRMLSKLYAPEGKLVAITLHPRLEQEIAESLQPTPQGQFPVLPPERSKQLLESLGQAVSRAALKGVQPSILCSGRIRLPLRRFLQRSLPQVPVLSYSELDPALEVEALEVINLNEN
ncbi:flagellar biosynthesis protein FlhA [Thermanaeromonas toyohensis ToBE]|uniref:Flagellar biosynthesis protein FlhA n=1 Tax=Thermanaeromonas toyohensis ToBE TaxID=698762 RepID=A0A1W1VL16_9FIRM|nr:flagellar biosynthesis protein FlhA [Thermanaeromonas toyohensis]SMB94075.1 flagellar biosynthesis protein FlhA [Thermanaeromonas toyohensis ToBE]